MPLQATFLRDRVTFRDFSSERRLVFAVSVMTEPLGW